MAAFGGRPFGSTDNVVTRQPTLDPFSQFLNMRGPQSGPTSPPPPTNLGAPTPVMGPGGLLGPTSSAPIRDPGHTIPQGNPVLPPQGQPAPNNPFGQQGPQQLQQLQQVLQLLQHLFGNSGGFGSGMPALWQALQTFGQGGAQPNPFAGLGSIKDTTAPPPPGNDRFSPLA